MTKNVAEKILTPAQRRAIEHLLTAQNAREAAKLAGVNPRTLYRWMQEPAFVAALREAESEAIAALSRSLVALGESATAALNDALDKKQKITVRLRASEIVIGNLLRLRELVDLEERLSKLEQMTNGNN